MEPTNDSSLDELTVEELARVSGGAGFFDDLYKGIVFNVAGGIGGPKMAQQIYGSRATWEDSARASAAMKKFLATGNKLPKGVPNLFG